VLRGDSHWFPLKTIVRALLGATLPLLASLLSPLFALVARTGYGVEICRRFGFHPIRLHYYQPIPRYESVPEATFTVRRDLPGVALDPDSTRATLTWLAAYGEEANWPRAPQPAGTYSAANDNFGFSSAALLHAMIRANGTRRVTEIGGGYSSLISLAALEKNHGPRGYRFTCVEPYPSAWLKAAIAERSGKAELIEQAVEKLPPESLAQLEAEDILFIDSSHCVRLASDVNFLYLQVLPRLKPGVIVHIHDIYLPYEYPRVHFFGRSKMFWNEQYLLEALLSENPRWEVILPGYMVQKDMEVEFRAAFPRYDPALDRKTSSFWLRRTG
jgi:predicted O-methyltransferase YrrM